MKQHTVYLPECTETMTHDITDGANGLALLIVYSLCMVFIVFTNSLFIFGLFRTTRKTLPSAQRIFFVLSCGDLMAGMIYVPIQIYFIVRKRNSTSPDISCTMTGARAFWSVFPIVFSGTMIMFLTLDRYLLMSRCKKKTKNNTIFSVYVITAFIVSFGWGISYTMISQESPVNSNEKTAIFFVSLATYEVGVLITCLVFNIFILVIVKRTTRNSTLADSSNKKKTAEHRLSQTIIIISSALIVTYLPSVFGLYLTGIYFKQMSVIELLMTKRDEVERYTKALIWSLVLTLINSGLNATIFIARNSRMKRMYQSIYNKNIKWREEESKSDTTSSPSSPDNSPSHQQ